MLNYLFLWELTFIEVLTLGKGGGDEGGKEILLFVFWWLQVLYLQHAYRQDLTRLPHLALKDQGLLHSKE